jgi:hypothetical protein
VHFLVKRRPSQNGISPDLPFEIWNLDWGAEPPVRKGAIEDVRAFFVSLRAPEGEIDTALFHLVERNSAQVMF